MEQDENDTYSIGKDGEYIHIPSCDLALESLKIKAVSEDGFELAMEDWERRSFPIVNIERCNNHLFNAINESPNATLTISGNQGFSAQELELIEMYRTFPLEKQLKLLSFAFGLKEEE